MTASLQFTGPDGVSKFTLSNTQNLTKTIDTSDLQTATERAAQINNAVGALSPNAWYRPLPTQISNSLLGIWLVIIDGVLYSSGNISGNYASYAGMGSSGGTPKYGVEGLTRVFVDTPYSIVKFGGNGHNNWCLDSAGNLFTWGPNAEGECGNGTTTAVLIPTLVMSSVTEVFDTAHKGYNVACSMWVRKTDNTIWCWGFNSNGELGLGTTTNVTTPTQNTYCGTNTRYILNVGGSSGYTLIQKSDNTIHVVGFNASYQCGRGAVTTTISSFTDVSANWGYTNGKIIAAYGSGSRYDGTTVTTSNGNTAILYENGAVYVCGNNTYGQMGNGTTTAVSTPYQLFSSSSNVIGLYARGGAVTTYSVLKSDGTYYVWGHTGNGQSGLGGTTAITTPTIVFSDVTNVFLSGENNYQYGWYCQHFIERTIGGIPYLYAAGYNGHEECGIGGFSAGTILTFTRVPIPGNERIVNMGCNHAAAGFSAILAVASSGRFYAWGNNGAFEICYPTTAIGTTISNPTAFRRPDVI